MGKLKKMENHRKTHRKMVKNLEKHLKKRRNSMGHFENPWESGNVIGKLRKIVKNQRKMEVYPSGND